MTIEDAIETALFDRLTLPDALAALHELLTDFFVGPDYDPLPIAWPNRPFTPPANGRYLRVDHMRNQNERLFVNGTAPHRRQGILQITVVTPLDVGAGPATEIAGLLATYFPADLRIYTNGIRISVQSAPDVTTAMKTDVSWDVPVSVRYEAFA